jgi:hypothetical protein
MTDIERLEAWIKAHDYTRWSLAKKMGIKYNTLYRMAINPRGTISDKFITLFIKHFGCSEALLVFQDTLSPVDPIQL